MTRTDIERQYDIDGSGHIRRHGKFEGEMLYVPYYWDIYLMGFANADDGDTLIFKVEPEDRQMFPELGSRRRVVRLRESSDGFVYEI